MKETELDKLREYLEEFEINPSYHRLKVLEYLVKHRTHPTADMIYTAISKDIPTLSKTTVYNTLNVFLEKGIVMALTIDPNEVRYDFNTTPHAHFQCIICGMIYDLETEAPSYEGDIVEGHRVLQHHVYLRGICRNCWRERDSKNFP